MNRGFWRFRKMLLGILAALTALSFAVALATDEPTPAAYRTVEVLVGQVKGKGTVNVRSGAGTDTSVVGRLHVGDECVVLGSSGEWYRVELADGSSGFVFMELLEVAARQEEQEIYIEDPLEAQVSGLATPTLLHWRNDYSLSGKVTSNIPMVLVRCEVYNLRTFKNDESVVVPFRRGDNVTEFNLAELNKQLRFYKMNPGEKRLIITAESSGESQVVSDTFFYVCCDTEAVYDEPASLTKDCEINVGQGKAGNMLDGDYRTSWAFKSAGEEIEVVLPQGKSASALTLHWLAPPEDARLLQIDENGAQIGSSAQTNPGYIMHQYFELDERARRLRITTSQAGAELCEIRVYETDRVPQTVQKWEDLPSKVDMMIFSAHQDDEELFFGGTIPYYSAQGKSVLVVYMANCGRRRYAEAMDGLWSCGLKYHPYFVGFTDKRISSYKDTVKLWGAEETRSVMVELMRRFEPDVIVTHDLEGEYGHNQHKCTSAFVREAVELASNAEAYPDSAAQYGLWTPKKLYIHLYPENRLTMKVYDEPMAELDGMTMTQVATIGYSKHVSQQRAFSMEKHGVLYDNRVFGLAFTTVGEDTEKTDMFEHVD